MTTPMAYNLPTQDSMSMIEEKDDSLIVEASLMGSIDTRFVPLSNLNFNTLKFKDVKVIRPSSASDINE